MYRTVIAYKHSYKIVLYLLFMAEAQFTLEGIIVTKNSLYWVKPNPLKALQGNF
jgi:hypothetical protein